MMRMSIPRWPSAIGAVQARLALQCVVSLLIAFAVMRLLPFPKPYWLALTALIVTANSFGETAAKSLERIIGTILGLLVGTLIWIAASRVPAAAVAIVVGCVFAIFYERGARYRTVLFWLSLLLSLLFHLADAPGSFYVARLADTLIGTVIAVLVTVVLLPVRTGDEVREQMAVLLDLAAGKLQRMASVLAQPGAHARDDRSTEVLNAVEKLSGLTAAEGLEALLLRHPRAEVRERTAAAERIGRCLLYADQLVPLLPGPETGVPAVLSTLAADIERVAQSVRHGSAAPRLGGEWDSTVQSRESATAAYRASRITLAQLQASLRLHEALAGMAEAVDQVAQSAPKAAMRSTRVVSSAFNANRSDL